MFATGFALVFLGVLVIALTGGGLRSSFNLAIGLLMLLGVVLCGLSLTIWFSGVLP